LDPPPPEAATRNRWVRAAWRSAALLVIPFLVWLLVPSPTPVAPPSTASEPASTTRSGGEVSRVTKEAARVRPASEVSPSRVPGTGAVAGHVEDPEGRPVAGATVTCSQGESELAASTDEKGVFELSAAAAGCKATARSRGFGPSAEEELRLGSGNRLRLQPPTGIAGHVVDEKSAPVRSYWIGVDKFTPAGSGDRPDAKALAGLKRAVEDPEGAFELEDLSAGAYQLVVSVGQGQLSRSQSIDVTQGAMTKGVRVVVHPPTTVSGSVTDAATHAPIEGARVFVGIGGLTTNVVPTVGGAYVVEGAPSGTFDLTAYAMGYRLKVVPGLQVPAGTTQLHVDVVLERLF
jgi:hypothetical protein